MPEVIKIENLATHIARTIKEVNDGIYARRLANEMVLMPEEISIKAIVIRGEGTISTTQQESRPARTTTQTETRPARTTTQTEGGQTVTETSTKGAESSLTLTTPAAEVTDSQEAGGNDSTTTNTYETVDLA